MVRVNYCGPTGVPDTRGASRRPAAAVRRPGIPSDQLPRIQRPALPLPVRVRLRARFRRLSAQDGRPHQGA